LGTGRFRDHVHPRLPRTLRLENKDPGNAFGSLPKSDVFAMNPEKRVIVAPGIGFVNGCPLGGEAGERFVLIRASTTCGSFSYDIESVRLRRTKKRVV
jgi:hypothetical protein